jgi:putative oxidoreductase
MTLVRLAARPLLASMFVVGGLDAIRTAGKKVDVAEPVTDRLAPLLQKVFPQLTDDPQQLVRINGAAQVGAGLLLASGHFPRLSATVLAATLVPVTAAGHRFWEEQDPQKKAQQRVHFFKNTSMLGGLLLAAVDTEGKPGVAWRTSHAVTSAKREAKHLRKGAAAQTKLAVQSVRP